MFRNLIVIVFVLISEIGVLSSQETSDFSEYNLTDMISDNSDNIFLSTEYGGIFISTDSGSSWKLTSKITKDYHVTSMIFNDYEGIFASTLEGQFLQSTDKGKSWDIRSGSAYYNGSFGPIRCMFQTLKLFKIYTGEGIRMSLDNHNFAGYGIGLNFLSDFSIMNNGTAVACGNSIFMNDDIDSFEPWVEINNGLNLYYNMTNCLEVKGNTVYIGRDSGAYYYDTNINKWNLVSDEIKDNKITDISILDNNLFVIAVDSLKILLSKNNGINWITLETDDSLLKVNKISYLNHEKVFVLTNKGGLYNFNFNDLSLTKKDYPISLESDSIFTEGWMPSINFKDNPLDIGSLNYLEFIDNDSSIVIKGDNDEYKVIETKTGILKYTFNFPDDLNVKYSNIINSDSVLIQVESEKNYIFNLYSMEDNNLIKEYFKISEDYFRELYPKNEYYILTKILSAEIHKNKLIIKYVISGGHPGPRGTYVYVNKYRTEIRDMDKGDVLKEYDNNLNFSRDFNCYLIDNFRLYNSNDEMIYDIKDIPDNSHYFNNNHDYYTAKFSKNNKFIVIRDGTYNDQEFLIVDFNTGKILRNIKYNYSCNYDISYDEKYIVTSSNESAIRIFNINFSVDSFDKVVFWSGSSNWVFDIADNSIKVVFGGYDGVLRLWEPDLSLTGIIKDQVEDEPEFFTIYPNPVNDILNISIAHHITNSLNICIFNQLGQVVFSDPSADITQPYKVNTGTFPPGIYFCKVSGNGISEVRSFVVYR